MKVIGERLKRKEQVPSEEWITKYVNVLKSSAL